MKIGRATAAVPEGDGRESATGFSLTSVRQYKPYEDLSPGTWIGASIQPIPSSETSHRRFRLSRFLDRFRVQRFILESRVDRSSPRLFPERRLSAATRTIRPGEPFGPIGRYIGYQQAILLDQLINYTCCT
ncbi:hypothetical protein FYC77_13190 [Natrialba swarupiae]|uniref:Uncharacterized protein n=1 Tax=Natrialba swarupiae TaxID=2448032 RepID=A0A5D5AHY8_9EURY|nr:hypothetical protein FYC77_13190 [Natrialba swarupiae]